MFWKIGLTCVMETQSLSLRYAQAKRVKLTSTSSHTNIISFSVTVTR